jgi:hypothetical protein
MILQVLNIEDIDLALALCANKVSHPAAKLWFRTVPKEHLLNLDEKLSPADKRQNFVAWTSKFQRCYEEMPDRTNLSALRIAEWCRTRKQPLPSALESNHTRFVLPIWVTDALSHGQLLYLFDPAAAENKQGIWTTMEQIQEWLNSEPPDMDYAGLSFDDARREVADFSPKPKDEVLKLDRAQIE